MFKKNLKKRKATSEMKKEFGTCRAGQWPF